MLKDALPHRIFSVDPYAIPEDFVANIAYAWLDNERADMLSQLLRTGGIESDLQAIIDCLQSECLDDVGNMMTTLEWLKNELNQEILSDVKLYYHEDKIGGYQWNIEGKVGADTANPRQFKLEYRDDWFDVIRVIMDGSLMVIFNFRDERLFPSRHQ